MAEAAERRIELSCEQRRIARWHLRAAIWLAMPFALGIALWERIESGQSLVLPAVFVLALLLLTPAAWFALAVWAWLRETLQNAAGFMFGD